MKEVFDVHPIETAPKDRLIVLVRRGVAAWLGNGVWDSEKHGQHPRPHWHCYDYAKLCGMAEMRAKQPTHWIELDDILIGKPAEPNETTTGGGA